MSGPITPKGWKKLAIGQIRKTGDKTWAWNEGPWMKIDAGIGCPHTADFHITIRKRPTPTDK